MRPGVTKIKAIDMKLLCFDVQGMNIMDNALARNVCVCCKSAVDRNYVSRSNTFSNGSRERPPAELDKVVKLYWFCECGVWSGLTAV